MKIRGVTIALLVQARSRREETPYESCTFLFKKAAFRIEDSSDTSPTTTVASKSVNSFS